MKRFLFLTGGVYLLDVVTKVLIRTHLPIGAEISIFPFFSLVHVTNTGVAFGLFQGRNYFFAVIGILFSVFMIAAAFRWQNNDPFLTAVLGLILAGAWGNLTDRVLYGRVTDFLDFFWGAHHWPAFNVADSAICVGAALILWESFRTKKSVRLPEIEDASEGSSREGGRNCSRS